MNAANTNAIPASQTDSADPKQLLLKDIGTKWNKFSKQELFMPGKMGAQGYF